jgi:hypothetical protein
MSSTDTHAADAAPASVNAAANAKPSEIAKAAVEGKPLPDGKRPAHQNASLQMHLLMLLRTGQIEELASKLSIKSTTSDNGSRQYPGVDLPCSMEWRC